MAAFSSVCSLTDNSGIACVCTIEHDRPCPRCWWGMWCCGGCHLTACSLTFICSPPRAALSRDRAKNAHKKRRDGGAWRHYNTHNSYNTCWWYKNFQGRSARLSAQQQPTTVQIVVVAVSPQQHRIQSTIDNKPPDLLNLDDAQYNCNCRL